MDRYLTRTPRERPEKELIRSPSLVMLKQSTIHSLKRVVVIEDIERLKSKLKLPNQSKPIILESLRELGKKIPPRNVLQSTKIGFTVRKLRRHEDEEIATEAKRIFTKWRSFFQDCLEKPQIEVKCDKKTETRRLRGKTLLAETLGVEAGHELVEAIERETFHRHKRLISNSYKRTIRTMILKLKHSEDLRNSVLNGHLPVEDFVEEYNKR
ncbi:unnamed protein product [Lymnaea stagnalis]|uniref:TFIIS N-terminal domain-containing protein n=1 Tax=Lymnaea stagnalis TaxID=6523 RepID=A0AAV2HKA9_LYMST